VFGMRQTARGHVTGAERCELRINTEDRIIKGENHALDNFCCASYSVVTGFQPAYSWSLIHLLLVVALIVLVINLFSGRRSAL